MDIKKDDLLINPPKQFRPISLWAWNTRLYKEETARQIAQMDEAGTGGVVIHARGGLRTGIWAMSGWKIYAWRWPPAKGVGWLYGAMMNMASQAATQPVR